jgi:hypothetical protein
VRAGEVVTAVQSVEAAAAGVSVVLEVGGDSGALVVHAPGAAPGAEVEIRRPSEPWRGAHSAVRDHRTPRRTRRACVFASLAQGSYEIRWRGPAPPGEAIAVVVRPGEVREVTLLPQPVADSAGGSTGAEVSGQDDARAGSPPKAGHSAL